METTIEIHDELLRRAERLARETGRPLRVVIEEGLRAILPEPETSSRYRLPDLSAGEAGDDDPLAAYSWQELRDIVYSEPDSR